MSLLDTTVPHVIVGLKCCMMCTVLIVTVLANFDIASTGAHTERSIEPHDLDGFAHTWAALTIGVHRCQGISETNEGLLGMLKNFLSDREDNEDADAVESAVFEDGPPHMAGKNLFVHHAERSQCSLHIVLQMPVPSSEIYTDPERSFFGGHAGKLNLLIDSVNVHDGRSRPYCLVSVHGTDAKGFATTGTNAAVMRKGTASWAESDDAELSFHITGFHTHLTVQCVDSFQFCDRSVSTL